MKLLKRVVPAFALAIVVAFAFVPAIPTHADAIDLYWVGGSGNWSDGTNHWSDASGGAPGHAEPTSTNNVFFDANSFSGAGQTVTVDANSSCADINWTGATNSPSFNLGSKQLYIYGDATFISAMSVAATAGNSGIWFRSNGTQLLTTNGVNIGCTIQTWYENTPTVSLQDDLNCTGTYAGLGISTGGTFATNNHNLALLKLSCSGAGSVLNLGSSVITISATGSNGWYINGTTVNAGTSEISTAGLFAGDSETYNIVNLTGATSTITGNNSFAELNFTRAGVQTITATGTTQTAGDFNRDAGTSVKTIVNGAFTKTGGSTVYWDYMSVSGNTASPANTFIAGVNSTNGGGNTDWIFVADVVTNAASGIEAELATLNGTLTTNGNNADTRGFQYGLTSGMLTSDWHQDGSLPTGAYSTQITGLEIGTTYYYRSYAITEGITEYGAELQFTTEGRDWWAAAIFGGIAELLAAVYVVIVCVMAYQTENYRLVLIGLVQGLLMMVLIAAFVAALTA